MVPGWFISELNAGGAKWGVEKTTKDLICIFALRSRPRPALVHKKMQTKYIKRFINQIQRSHTPKKEYQKREAFGIPFPYQSFQTISHLVSLSLSCSDQIVLIVGYQLSSPIWTLYTNVNFMLSQIAFHERCQKLCANIVSQCGLGWHNQQTDITPLS